MKWHFDQTTKQGDSFSRPTIEYFREGDWAYLARETIQNSIDAALGTEPVKIKFTLSDILCNQFPDREGILRHIKGTLKKREANNPQAHDVSHMRGALSSLEADELKILKISDYNTKGVLGSTNIENNTPWKSLIYDEGNSQKDSTTAAGSHGLGKNAPFAFSTINTVFYVTRDKNNNYALQGVTKLYTSWYEDKKYDGDGFFEIRNNDGLGMPLCESDVVKLPDIFRREEYGTDVMIMAVKTNVDNISSEIIKAVVENFFIAIFDRRLEVDIFGVIIKASNIQNFANKHCRYEIENVPNTNIKYGFVNQYIEAYQMIGESSKAFHEDLFDYGEVDLFLTKGDNISGKYVAMHRSQGMKIFDYKVQKAEQQFSGVCVVRGTIGNEFLLSLENPAHTKFDPEGRIQNKSDCKIAKDKLDALYIWIKAQVYDFTKIEIKDNTYLYGMEDYIELNVDESKPKPRIKAKPEIIMVVAEKPETHLYEDRNVGVDPDQDGEEIIPGTNPHIHYGEGGKPASINPESEQFADKHIEIIYAGYVLGPNVIVNKNELIAIFQTTNNVPDKYNLELIAVGEDNSYNRNIPTITSAEDLDTGVEVAYSGNTLKGVTSQGIKKIKVKFSRNARLKYHIQCYWEETAK